MLKHFLFKRRGHDRFSHWPIVFSNIREGLIVCLNLSCVFSVSVSMLFLHTSSWFWHQHNNTTPYSQDHGKLMEVAMPDKSEDQGRQLAIKIKISCYLSFSESSFAEMSWTWQTLGKTLSFSGNGFTEMFWTWRTLRNIMCVSSRPNQS